MRIRTTRRKSENAYTGGSAAAEHAVRGVPEAIRSLVAVPSTRYACLTPVCYEANMTVRHANDVPREPVTAGSGTVRQVLIGPDEGPHFAMRRFIMEPGGGMPPHTNTVEHEQYVLRGRATIGIGKETREVSAGDVVYIAAGTPHWYKAHAGEPFEFLCMVPNLPDTIAVVGEQPNC